MIRMECFLFREKCADTESKSCVCADCLQRACMICQCCTWFVLLAIVPWDAFMHGATHAQQIDLLHVECIDYYVAFFVVNPASSAVLHPPTPPQSARPFQFRRKNRFLNTLNLSKLSTLHTPLAFLSARNIYDICIQ